MKYFLILVTAMLLSACTTSSVIRTAPPHAPIAPEQVHVYFSNKLPGDYQVLGLMDAHSEIIFSSRKAQERAISRLIEEAAQIGANGVLITFERDYPTETVVIDPDFPIYTVEVDFTKVLKAEAILVAPAVATR